MWLLALFPRGMEEGMAGRASGELYWFGREVWIRNLTCLWGLMEPNSWCVCRAALPPHTPVRNIKIPKGKPVRSFQVSPQRTLTWFMKP